jgi:hypothetical protein
LFDSLSRFALIRDEAHARLVSPKHFQPSLDVSLLAVALVLPVIAKGRGVATGIDFEHGGVSCWCALSVTYPKRLSTPFVHPTCDTLHEPTNGACTMLTLILIIAGIVFGVLALAGVPGRISWSGAGVVCLGAAMLIGRGLG